MPTGDKSIHTHAQGNLVTITVPCEIFMLSFDTYIQSTTSRMGRQCV